MAAPQDEVNLTDSINNYSFCDVVGKYRAIRQKKTGPSYYVFPNRVSDLPIDNVDSFKIGRTLDPRFSN
jgi:hypothetical protein